MTQLQRAYLLHARPYQENKLLLSLFCERAGRSAAIVSVGGKMGSLKKSQLQIFRPLLVTLKGRSSLQTLGQLDAPSLPLPLSGWTQLSGFYLNELCYRLLPEGQCFDDLFIAYHQALMGLAATQIDPENNGAEPILRQFELVLLKELGQTPSLLNDITGQPIIASGQYQLLPEQGFIPVAGQQRGYLGATLINWEENQLIDLEQRQQAKQLARILLQPYLGTKPLHSRTLFKKQRGRQ